MIESIIAREIGKKKFILSIHKRGTTQVLKWALIVLSKFRCVYFWDIEANFFFCFAMLCFNVMEKLVYYLIFNLHDIEYDFFTRMNGVYAIKFVNIRTVSTQKNDIKCESRPHIVHIKYQGLIRLSCAK